MTKVRFYDQADDQKLRFAIIVYALLHRTSVGSIKYRTGQ